MLIQLPKTRYLTLEEAIQKSVDEDWGNGDRNEIDVIVISPQIAEAIDGEKGNDNISKNDCDTLPSIIPAKMMFK